MDWSNREEVNAYNREYRRKNNSNKKYYEAHKEIILAKQKEYLLKNSEVIKERQKKWRDEHKEQIKGYRESRKEADKEYRKKWYEEHREEEIRRCTEYNKAYSKTPIGRAQRQLQQYKYMDKRNGFGDVIDFNAKWIVDNIYTKPCVHCGETDWKKLGCNRLDNSKPHTIDNVESCCFHCNCVLKGNEDKERIVNYGKSISIKVAQYTVDDKLLCVYPSMIEAERQTGVPSGNISRCCRGKGKTAGGYIWRFAS